MADYVALYTDLTIGRRVIMDLTMFLVFVSPWMLFALWLTRSPSAIRLGAPSAPWRQLPRSRDWLQEQERREAIRQKALAYVRPGSAGETKHELQASSSGGALGTSVEDTEPRE